VSPTLSVEARLSLSTAQGDKIVLSDTYFVSLGSVGIVGPVHVDDVGRSDFRQSRRPSLSAVARRSS